MNPESKRNIKGAVLLIPLVVIVVLLVIVARPDDRYDDVIPGEEYADTVAVAEVVTFREFDPNSADYRELVEAGLPRNIAVGIIRWREAGKVYRIKEDLALCYGMTDSLYFLIEPYIHIGQEYRYQVREFSNGDRAGHAEEVVESTFEGEPFMLDTVDVDDLVAVGFSERQAEVVLRYRDIIGGYESINDFARCYVVDSAMVVRLTPYLHFPERDTLSVGGGSAAEVELVEINSADSATLRSVYGIGPRSVVQIMRYRELLGGFYSVEQISELDVVTEENFQRILPQIWCDSAKIKKININFARPNELEVHPYLSNRMLRRIINHRELKGGWSTIEEMIEDNIFSDDEAARIAPYLDFGTTAQ